jgi:heme-degrading monooxygenase HmoA
MYYARQLVAIIRQDAMREAADAFRRDVVPLLRQQCGFVGTTMLFDRDSRAAQFVTCWRSLSDLAQLNENRFFEAQVAKLASYFATKPEVKIVDVYVFEEQGDVQAEAGPAAPPAEGGS